MKNRWTRGNLVREGRKIHRKLGPGLESERFYFQFLKYTSAHLHLDIYLSCRLVSMSRLEICHIEFTSSTVRLADGDPLFWS